MFNVQNAKLICFNMLTRLEDLKLVAYKRFKGIWTIAIGITKVNGKPIYKGMTCTKKKR